MKAVSLLLVSIAFSIGITAAPSINPPIDQQKINNSSHSTPQSPDNQASSADERIAFYTELLAAFTLALVVVGAGTATLFICQNILLRRTLNHAKESTQHELRAYVGIAQGEKSKKLIKDGERLNFEPEIINYGKTPAYDLTIDYNVVTASIETGLTQFPTIKFVKPSKGTLFPTQKVYADCRSEDKYSHEDIKALPFAGEAIFLYGTIHYRDAFHEKGFRWTNFCFEIKVKRNRITGWHVTDSHNDSS